MLFTFVLLSVLFQQDPGETVLREEFEQRYHQFKAKRSIPLLISQALVFAMDEENAIGDVIDMRRDWRNKEIALVRQSGKRIHGVQLSKGSIVCKITLRPDLFSIDTVLMQLSISYITTRTQEIEKALLDRGFKREDLAHLRFWKTPGNAPIDAINRTSTKLAWMDPEDSIFNRIAQKKFVTDQELEAQVEMEEASEREAKKRWVVGFLEKLSRHSRRVLLSYVFNESSRSLTQYHDLNHSQHIRDQAQTLRLIIQEHDANPALQKELKDLLREKIDEYKIK